MKVKVIAASVVLAAAVSVTATVLIVQKSGDPSLQPRGTRAEMREKERLGMGKEAGNIGAKQRERERLREEVAALKAEGERQSAAAGETKAAVERVAMDKGVGAASQPAGEK